MVQPTLTDVPSEVVLEYLLPVLPVKDIAALSGVNRHLHALTSDPTFWRLKTTSDFSFSPSSLPPSPSSSWWTRVYLGLLHPRAFVWGSSDHGRLGGAELGRGVRRFGRFVDSPAEMMIGGSDGRTFPETLRDSLRTVVSGGGGGAMVGSGRDDEGKGTAGVVELQAGGWSFTARCSDGSVWVWGQLDGTIIRFRAPSWEDKNCQCPEPTKIPLPCRAEAISAGRRHLLVLDADNLIWELTAWGKAYHHTAPALTAPSSHGTTRNPPHIAQLSTGWDHSAALASDGSIHVWFPFSQAYEAGLTPDDRLNGPIGVFTDSDGDEDSSRALRWGTVGNDVVVTLPEIPERPVLDTHDDDWTDLGGEVVTGAVKGPKMRKELEDEWKDYESTRTAKDLAEGQKVVRIAGGLEFLIALRKNGEVWHTRVKERHPITWQFLPYFSSPNITHITAQFESITTYATPTAHSSASAVYHSRLPHFSESFGETLQPDLLPALQDKGVIQVALGDYHYAALTSRGEMYTWGQGGSGQLGLGGFGGGRKDEPTRVVFKSEGDDDGQREGEEDFVFAITAGGWHTGALILGDPKRKRPKTTTGRTASTTTTTSTGLNLSYADTGNSGGHSFMPGAFPSGTTERRGGTIPAGSVTLPRGGIRTMPFFRVGFAGRGAAVSGRGRGGAQSQGQAHGHGVVEDGEVAADQW
ncbi:hypothetical protein CI109_100473 [Kwoniella shandongensis]|uniref:Uncharacterized protein n=1 Tax=Kwoniella shandongensis TaxID=1734106 RepID=A0A5M6C8J5_9TREE|nr:uncharacterized protein CI109_001684 [Kwoniella shandongensis]KAA5529745.1 hypothetical protein CI109_001684 [Kwoniella shandongensis]